MGVMTLVEFSTFNRRSHQQSNKPMNPDTTNLAPNRTRNYINVTSELLPFYAEPLHG
ncbi:hypothetical protein J6590_072899 [Homalodisca vitripennis]|nr:hypothetical protein J6590_072899 [Homalodisca vitripennis]